MIIGKLNRRVELLEYMVTRDEFGGEDGTWVLFDTVWANINTTSGTEFFNNQQVNAVALTTITIRYHPKINVMNRVRHGSSVYEITSVINDDMANKTTILNCKELISDELQRETKTS